MKHPHVFVIAEAGVNHNGSLDMARQLIDLAAEAGADAVKFQTFQASKLVTAAARKADYQVVNTGVAEAEREGEAGGQLAMLKKLELDEAAHDALVAHAKARGVEFMSTPFDVDSLDFLVKKLGVTRLKLGSGDLTNAQLLLAAARSGLPLILSTGMSTLAEVEAALAVLAFGYSAAPDARPGTDAFQAAWASAAGQAALAGKVTLLHCTTEYPTPFDQVNLRAMDTLAQAFSLPVGLSDHTPGISAALAAAARGAVVVEKHFTLDKSLPGPDHVASLSPDELHALVQGLREVQHILGSAVKAPAAVELSNRAVARRGLVAAAPIRKGEAFTEANLAVKRGGGVPAIHFWDWIGRSATRAYAEDEAIREPGQESPRG
ncbi:MAG: N-acetylneuraminate synthase [Moraxellaceae bacterium]|nr:N-acetylneuraminate synthase [Moraxellaceae bacterium]